MERFKMQLLIAARNLMQAKRRTFFLTAALSMVTLLLVMLLALAQGLTNTMIHSALTLSAGHLNVAGFYKATLSDAAPIVTDVDEIRRVVDENTPGLDYVVDRHRGWARIVTESSSLQAGLTGIDITQEPRFKETIQLAEERDYKEGGRAEIVGNIDRLSERGSAMIFVAQAKRLGVTVGDSLTLVIETLSGARNTGEVTIVAVAKDVGMMSNWSVFLQKATILDLYRLQPDTSGAVMVYLKDIDQAEKTMGHLREVFAAKGYRIMEHEPQPFWMKFEKVSGEDWLGQKLDLTIWSDEVSFLQWVLTAVNTVSFFLIGILLVIIVIGIMNSMYISVRERTREIGTVRAMGMSRGNVLRLFMLEAVILGVSATLLGGIAGGALAAALDAAKIIVPSEAVQAILMSDTLHLAVRPGQILSAVAAFTLVTAFAALWPALRAAKLQPVEAIQSVT
ncbi:MAG: ABC transporter permease [Deltaproteobacteria bacterium]|nr:ABC transporter permease [Deltaproteobacteria bacterium]